jgi:hypothetical protein
VNGFNRLTNTCRYLLLVDARGAGEAHTEGSPQALAHATDTAINGTDTHAA